MRRKDAGKKFEEVTITKDKGKKKLEPTQAQAAGGRHNGNPVESRMAAPVMAGGVEDRPKMSRKEFEKELEKLQIELVKMQEWVKATGAKVCMLRQVGTAGVLRRMANAAIDIQSKAVAPIATACPVTAPAETGQGIAGKAMPQ